MSLLWLILQREQKNCANPLDDLVVSDDGKGLEEVGGEGPSLLEPLPPGDVQQHQHPCLVDRRDALVDANSHEIGCQSGDCLGVGPALTAYHLVRLEVELAV